MVSWNLRSGINNLMKHLISFSTFLTESVRPSEIDVAAIEPEPKDLMRARNMRANADSPEARRGAAEAQSKLIRDPYKLVRRAKAVAAEYGVLDYFPEDRARLDRLRHLGLGETPSTWNRSYKQDHDAWAPFARALTQMGFTDEQIRIIGNWRPTGE